MLGTGKKFGLNLPKFQVQNRAFHEQQYSDPLFQVDLWNHCEDTTHSMTWCKCAMPCIWPMYYISLASTYLRRPVVLLLCLLLYFNHCTEQVVTNKMPWTSFCVNFLCHFWSNHFTMLLYLTFFAVFICPKVTIPCPKVWSLSKTGVLKCFRLRAKLTLVFTLNLMQ